MALANAARALGLAVSVGLAIVAHCYDVHAIDATAPAPDATVKLQSDQDTRASMERIRQHVIDVHTLITHRRMPVASAKQFAKDVGDDVERIVQHRVALVRDGDPITPILQQIKRGAAAIADPKPYRGPIDGLVDVVAGLEAYAEAFDHPGWRRLQEQ